MKFLSGKVCTSGSCGAASLRQRRPPTLLRLLCLLRFPCLLYFLQRWLGWSLRLLRLWFHFLSISRSLRLLVLVLLLLLGTSC